MSEGVYIYLSIDVTTVNWQQLYFLSAVFNCFCLEILLIFILFILLITHTPVHPHRLEL